jgi:hypothetical protein
MPIQRPSGYNSWRKLWWTVGNHGPYVLDENTLESDVIDVDFAGKTLTVPWGVGRLDDIMNYFEEKTRCCLELFITIPTGKILFTVQPKQEINLSYSCCRE